MKLTWHRSLALLLALAGLWTNRADAATSTNTLVWDKAKDRVDADVRGWELASLLERVASETGWHVFVEPEAAHQASVKFKNLPSGEALRALLGDLNFALVPQTNSSPRLYVFRTAMRNATRLIRPMRSRAGQESDAKRVTNELIVRLKPGANIDELARLFGAKVTGRIPELNTYRLEFDDDAAAELTRNALTTNPDVEGVDYNYYVDRPPAARQFGGTAQPPQLRMTPPPDTGRIIIGVLDTAVQPLGADLEKFITKRLSVAGDALPSEGPTHGTSMVQEIMSALGTATKGETSATFLLGDIFGPNPMTTTFDIANGLILLVNNGANYINASVGGSGNSAALESAIRLATERGIAIFAPSGNEPTGAAVYPGSYPNVVTVTALRSPTELAPYANVNGATDVAAPGSGIISYQGQAYLVQGTSVATAFTTGMAAGTAEKSGKSWAEVQPVLLQKLPLPAGTKP